MTVAVIGTGKMGSGLAKLIASKGIDVAIGHRDPAKAIAMAKEIGSGVTGGSSEEAAKISERSWQCLIRIWPRA
jgi:predicted dinucleotide-binding enzyme